MTPEEFKDYVTGRYDDQCGWYDGKAGFNKRWYYRFQTTVIGASALTTLVVALGVYFDEDRWVQIIALVFSTVTIVTASLVKFYKFHENWVEYRTTAETLKKEKHLFDARLGDYDGAASPEQLFVGRVEDLISRQNTLWTGRVSEEADQDTRS